MATRSGPTRRAVQFTAPRTVDVVDQPVGSVGSREVRVRTRLSAVSPGTERLVYRGEAPGGAADTSIDALEGAMEFPLAYGYSTVGEVVECGSEVSADWLGQRVFAFQPHVSEFSAGPDSLVALPDGVDDLDAALIPNLETAINLVMDGRPMIGERVAIFGQGVVGLLTTAVLAQFPIDVLAIEPTKKRRVLAGDFGATDTFDPASGLASLRTALGIDHVDAVEETEGAFEGADLVFELSGKPDILNDALTITGFNGRIIVGSWYGTKRAPIQLGERYHRSRIDIRSSQVSTIDPSLRGRWSTDRRMQTVLRLLDSVRPGRLVTDIHPVEDAPAVYAALTDPSADMLQPVFRYDGDGEAA